jgi:hypothetical protein
MIDFDAKTMRQLQAVFYIIAILMFGTALILNIRQLRKKDARAEL